MSVRTSVLLAALLAAMLVAYQVDATLTAQMMVVVVPIAALYLLTLPSRVSQTPWECSIDQSKPSEIVNKVPVHNIDALKALPLIDCAFVIVHHRSRYRYKAISLMEVFPQVSEDQAAGAIARASNLLSHGDRAGDELLRHGTTTSPKTNEFVRHQIMASLREDCPGFGEASYIDAIDYGCFINR